MSHPFDQPIPDLALGAVESLGYPSDAQVSTPNSYENRVYQVSIEDGEPLVAKFYRPNRQSGAAIHEEHTFSARLAEYEVPVVTPLSHDDESPFAFAGFHFVLFPRCNGYVSEPDNLDQPCHLGQLFSRLHAIGATRPSEHREALAMDNFGHASLATSLEGSFVPRSLPSIYELIVRDLLKRLDVLFIEVPYQPIRLHGNCHPGSLLCRDEVYHVVNLDDRRMGPALQDLWMMLVGERHERLAQITELIDGCSKFHDFDPHRLSLLEGLRSLRLMHYSTWLVWHWSDPAFPSSFPWFDDERHWGEQALVLREQLAALDEGLLRPF